MTVNVLHFFGSDNFIIVGSYTLIGTSFRNQNIGTKNLFWCCTRKRTADFGILICYVMNLLKMKQVVNVPRVSHKDTIVILCIWHLPPPPKKRERHLRGD